MRNERLNIYVTDDEKEIIDQNARAYGMTRSEYLRHVALCFDEECDDSEKLHADFLLLCERIHKLTEKPFADTFMDDSVEILEDFFRLISRYRRATEFDDD